MSGLAVRLIARNAAATGAAMLGAVAIRRSDEVSGVRAPEKKRL